MKTLLRILFAFMSILPLGSYAQAPQAFTYQAVARDNSGSVIAGQTISLRISIHDATANGTIVYKETHQALTNLLGLFSINLGQGTVVTGTFAGIDWPANSKFIQVEMDPAGGTSYTDMGTQQILSVPYALYSSKSGGTAGGDLSGTYPSPAVSKINGSPLGTMTGAGTGQVIKWNGASWSPGTDNNSNGTVTNVSALSPLSSTGGTTPVISMSGIVPVVSGGTGTGTSFTSGSVIFAGGSGIYSQDNAGFFWDNANNRLGIGTSLPSEKLDAIGNIRASTLVSGQTRMVQATTNGVLTTLAPGSATQVLLGTGVFGNVPTNTCWSLTGNAGTVDGTNFIGTTDGAPLNFKVGGQNAGRIDNTSNATFLGYKAGNVNTGLFNTAMGYEAMKSHTTGQGNTAFGNSAMSFVTNALYNTAIGNGALYQNITGSLNTAVGSGALGASLTSNNTAVGYIALASSSTGSGNTAVGSTSMSSTTSGGSNCAFGDQTMKLNETGFNNTAIGSTSFLYNVSGSSNTAVGASSLQSCLGSNNIGVGDVSGLDLVNGNNNILIGNRGNNTESNTIRIGRSGTHTATFIYGISGITSASGVPVLINPLGQLGTVLSSKKFKRNITDMGDISADIYKLHPVTFYYKDEFANGDKSLQYGLIAEETAEVFPDLIARDLNGDINTVRYHLLTPLMLNELLKEHQLNLNQNETILSQQDQIKKLSEELELLKSDMESFRNAVEKLKAEL